VILVRTDVSEERIASIIGVKRISEVGTTLAACSNSNIVHSSLIVFTLITEAILSSETSVLTRATRRHIPEHGILLREVLVSRLGQDAG
jgi:hypothetical protein